MAFQLPNLPYPEDALEPTIDAQTMQIHHNKHHQAYVTNVNNAIAGTEWDNVSVEDLCRRINEVPENIRTAVRNNGGGHANHSLFWTIMGPGAGGNPTGEVGSAIDSTFGSSGLDCPGFSSSLASTTISFSALALSDSSSTRKAWNSGFCGCRDSR